MIYVLIFGVLGSWVLIVAGCWLGWQLLRQNGRILLRLEAVEKRLNASGNGEENGLAKLPMGSPAPEFELADLSGKQRRLVEFVGQPLLLIFFNPACGFCRELAPKLGGQRTEVRDQRAEGGGERAEVRDERTEVRSQKSEVGEQRAEGKDHKFIQELTEESKIEQNDAPQLLIISTGDAEENRKFFAEHKIDCPVLLQDEMEIAMAYGANGTPSGYVIDAQGSISSELALGGEALLALASELRGQRGEVGDQKSELRSQAAEVGGQESDQSGSSRSSEAPAQESKIQNLKSQISENDGRTSRFSNRSVANSKLKRDGLKAGTVAPDFRLALIEGGELSLAELRGRTVLLVFSSPHCGPCNTLAPKLEKFHRKHADIQVVMISRGEPSENREKVKEHGLTFPVVLQKQWEISRLYAMFATPVAYLIDSSGVVTADVAVGVDPILELMTKATASLQNPTARKGPLLKRVARWPLAGAAMLSSWLLARLTLTKSKIDTFYLKHFKFVPRPDDIFIVTYPRSGTTWMQMILYQLTTDGSMELDHIAEHSPWFEHSPEGEKGYEERPSPRVFKTHLPYQEIPKGLGHYIYVARDGRDVAVSYYHLYRSHNGYRGTFDEFFELFMRGKVVFGSWFDHIGGWWNHRHQVNALFLTYEELVADLEGCIRRIIAFCHLQVPPERLPLIVERCSFAFMKQHEDKFDPAVEALMQQGARLNLFLRAGRVGEGARKLSEEQRARFEAAFQVHLESNSFGWPEQVQLQPASPRAVAAS